MTSHSVFFLSLASVSAVMLGICVTVRNNAYSTILRHFDEDIQLGNSDYERILRRSGGGAMAAGVCYSVSIFGAFSGVLLEADPMKTNWPVMVTLGFFAIGFLGLLFSLLTGHIKLGNPFRAPKKPEEPDRDDRPEIEPRDE
ncbi:MULTISPECIES: hypothetical protein [Haloferacaceae]|uniref:DUF2721 domain-containing protein n=1 Tax=Halorubrum glutamatedens TaxID=2707018 RepID=A0ABD5QW19_9EURY|nr:hypothetical protein [Halobellus captivus]